MKRVSCLLRATLVLLVCLLPLLFMRPAYGAFESVDLGARALGMGGSFTALVNDVSALRWNPAGLPHTGDRQLALSYLDLYGLVGYSALAFAQPMADMGWGIGLNSSDDTEGLYQEVEFSVAGSYPATDRLSVGVTLRALNSQAAMGDISVGTGRGVAFDVGFQHHFAEDRLTAGLVLVNLLSHVAYYRHALWRGPETRYGEALTREYRFGIAYRGDWKRPFVCSAETVGLHTWRVGIEVQALTGLLLRAGVRLGEGLEQGWTVGMGYRIGMFQLDYAYAAGRFDFDTSQMSLRLML